jgi:hypothetical protein
MKTLTALTLSCSILLASLSCKKDGIFNSSDVKIIGQQSLTATKKTIRGKWKMHYRYGGFSGVTKVIFPDTYLDFTTTNFLVRLDSNIQTIASPLHYTFQNVFVADYSTYVIQIDNPNNMMSEQLFAYATKGDTLILAETHTETEMYFLTKK